MTFTFCSIVCRRKSAKCGNQNSCFLLCGSLFRDLYNVHTIANYFLSLLVNSKVLDTRAIINIRNWHLGEHLFQSVSSERLYDKNLRNISLYPNFNERYSINCDLNSNSISNTSFENLWSWRTRNNH